MPSLPPLGREFASLLPERFLRLLEQWREIIRLVPPFFEGNGEPEGTVAATRGALYLRLDGAPGQRLYIKTTSTGASGWEAV